MQGKLELKIQIHHTLLYWMTMMSGYLITLRNLSMQ